MTLSLYRRFTYFRRPTAGFKNLIAGFYLRAEIAFLHFYAPACLDGLGYLLHRGEEHQHAHCCQHTAVYLTDGRSDETAYNEQEADSKGEVECTHGNND